MGKCLPFEKSRTRVDIVAASNWIKFPSLGPRASLVINYTFSKSQTKDENKQQHFRNWREGQERSWFMIFLSSYIASSHQGKQKSAIFRLLQPTPQLHALFSSLVLSSEFASISLFLVQKLNNGLGQSKCFFLGLLEYPYDKHLSFWTILYLNNHHNHNLLHT